MVLQEQSYNRDHRNDRYEQNDCGYRGERHDNNQRIQYGNGRRYDRHDRYDNSRRGYERRDYRYSAGSHYRVRRGEYLAHQYRGSRYVVSDWRGRRLYAPRGHHWVQTGND